MLLIFTAFLLLLASVSLVVYLKKVFSPKQIEEHRHSSLAATSFRPLFEPTNEDLRQYEVEENAKLAAELTEESRLIAEKKLVNLEKLRQTWRESPNRAATTEFLYMASQTESGEAYLETAEIVVAAWKAGNISGLLADDLVKLLDSHFWLLPTHERTPGVSFRLKEALTSLGLS